MGFIYVANELRSRDEAHGRRLLSPCTAILHASLLTRVIFHPLGCPDAADHFSHFRTSRRDGVAFNSTALRPGTGSPRKR